MDARDDGGEAPQFAWKPGELWVRFENQSMKKRGTSLIVHMQEYMLAGGSATEDARQHAAMLVAQLIAHYREPSNGASEPHGD